jgi:membrane associated rhomboid family serine protease
VQVQAGTGGVAFWAHIAGFVAGVAWGLAFRKPRPEQWPDLDARPRW